MKNALMIGAVIVMAACGRQPEPANRTAVPIACTGTATAVIQRLPKGDAALPTTDATQFLEGFNGQIAAAERMVLEDPTSASKRALFASLLGARGKLSSDLDEIQRAIDATTRAIELAPDEPGPWLERASLSQSLHRFPAARADLAVARKLGGSLAAIEALETELDWNQGKTAPAAAAIRAARAKRATMWTVSREARLLHDLGDYAGADRLYAEAEDLIEDTSPVPVAFLNFQRGFHAYEIGRLEEAIVFYREAVRRMPTWITAEEHLAEVLVLTGRVDEALVIYEDVTSRSQNPEIFGVLATVYRNRGRIADADALDAKAKAGFDAYERKFPEAAYGHASEYFLGRDPRRALAMREANVALRPNGLTIAALAEARLATGDAVGALEAIDRALATPLKSPLITWTAARVYATVGNPSKAAAFAAQACAANPRSALDRAPLP